MRINPQFSKEYRKLIFTKEFYNRKLHFLRNHGYFSEHPQATACTKNYDPAGIYLLKVNNRNTRTRCEICSKLTIKTPERRH